MNILKTIEVTLTEEDIKKIIAEKVESELQGCTVLPDNVDILIGTRLSGNCTDECTESYIKCGKVHCVIKEEE